MKKFLAALAAAALLAGSCMFTVSQTETHQKAAAPEPPEVTYTYRGVVKDSRMNQVSTVARFGYDGHSYIQFHVRGGYGGSDAVVHDPECHCLVRDSIPQPYK